MTLIIREMSADDWPQVAAIYEAGIESELSTFRAELPSWEEWDETHIKECRLVAVRGDTILGWAALSPYSSRTIFRGVAEESVYIAEAAKRQGVGSALLKALIKESERNGYWTLMARIIGENSSSIQLHKKCGFREVGYREKIAQMRNGRWHDLVIMEKRSKIVGI